MSTNKIYAGQHWSKRKEFADGVLEYAMAFCRPIKRVESYPVEISYRFFFASKPLDTTNCTYLVKCLEDALRTIRVLEEDDPAHVARTIIEVVKLDSKKKKTQIRSMGAKVDAKNEDYVEITIDSYAEIKNRLE